jgi:3-hydroxybutyryl-CoA dehydrogenase
MGGGIAQTLARAGCDVVLADVDAETSSAAVERLIAQAELFEKNGLFEVGAAERIRSHFSPASTIEAGVADADYITEAVPEIRHIKLDVLSRVSAVARPDAIIGSNTSAIPIGELANSVTRPERFLGVHWMNPAPFIPSVELIPTLHTDPTVLGPIEELLRKARKVPTTVSDSPGFVANRLQFALFKEAVTMVEEGLATPEQIDLVVANAFGFRLALFGPFAIADMAGLDVYNSSYRSLEAEYGSRLAAPDRLAALVAAGHLGVKSGGGFLDIDPDDLPALLEYRDNAYARLAQLRTDLGVAPGLAS